MIVKCKECGTSIEIDDSQYTRGKSHIVICPLCGAHVNFSIIDDNKNINPAPSAEQETNKDHISNEERNAFTDAKTSPPCKSDNAQHATWVSSNDTMDTEAISCDQSVACDQSAENSAEEQSSLAVESSRVKKNIFILLSILLIIGGLIFYFILCPSSIFLSEQNEENSSLRNRDVAFEIGNVSFCLKYVEGGTFTMGATNEQAEYAEKEEFPAHTVTVHDYYIGETEVTQELWEEVMGYNPANTIGTSLPIENVSWNDCADFIRELNHRTGKTFRLPTEAEWEYAARGGKFSHQYLYAGSNNVEEVGWIKSNCDERTHPVKSRNPNELGIYDMTGNICEWCQDWMGDYSGTTLTNPVGPQNGTARVGRGGGWCNSSSRNRVSTRFAGKTTYRDCNLGFRIAM